MDSIVMFPNARPGENPADIIDGTSKWKASECSMLAKDLAPKKAKVTTATDKTNPIVKKAATMMVKSAELVKKVFTRMKQNRSCMFLL
jgi:hypothetical protein